jgi:hypothetical protein
MPGVFLAALKINLQKVACFSVFRIEHFQTTIHHTPTINSPSKHHNKTLVFSYTPIKNARKTSKNRPHGRSIFNSQKARNFYRG